MPAEAQAIEYATVTVGIGCLLQPMLQRLEVASILDRVLRFQPEVPTTYGTLAQVIIINPVFRYPQTGVVDGGGSLRMSQICCWTGRSLG